jgi:hypothetical protein
MRTVGGYRKQVEKVERGECPAGFRDRDQARAALVRLLCGTSWRTVEEQEIAYGLVARLEHLRDIVAPRRWAA